MLRPVPLDSWELMGYSPSPWAWESVHRRPERFRAYCTCRQCGKTYSLALEIFEALTSPPRENDKPGQAGEPNFVGLLSFDYDHAEMALERLMTFMLAGFGPGYFKYNKNDHLLTITGTGAKLRIYSAESPNATQGPTHSAFFIDEAQNVSDAVFYNLRPSLSARLAPLTAFGTPDIVPDNSWFYGLFLRGQEADESNYFSFTLPCTLNPFSNAEDIREARSQLTEREFRMKYLGQWVDVEGQVFKGVDACFTGRLLDGPEPGSRYGIGVDIAQADDFTVAYVVDTTYRKVVDRLRFNGVSYASDGVPARLVALSDKWNPGWILMDATGVGKPVYDTLLEDHNLPVQPFVFSSKSKPELVADLVRDIEKTLWTLPVEDTVLRQELKAFRRVVTPSGNIRYRAPMNYHDDCVMALGLAAQGAKFGAAVRSSNYLD